MGKLILLGTTIGNIEDVSIRSLRHIFESEVVLAEDTREFLKFKRIILDRYLETLKSLEIKTETHQQLISYREQNHNRSLNGIVNLLEEKDVLLVTDSGMPGISDPGWRLIDAVLENDTEIDVIPGPSAAITSLILSGLPTDKFIFLGFLQRKAGRVKKLFESLDVEEYSVVFFESPFRVVKSIELIQEVFGEDILIGACGEMTKKFQRVERGTPSEILEKLKIRPPKGEWSVVVRKYQKPN